MSFIIENLRLKELAVVAEQNRPMFDDFVGFLELEGYASLHAFVQETDAAKGNTVFVKYLSRDLPKGIELYDGIARPYQAPKAKWLLLGWIFRDAPEQRLRPMLSTVTVGSAIQKQAFLYNKIRVYSAAIFPHPSKWTWDVISEVVVDRLEGSRRSIKGTLFEAIVRDILTAMFAGEKLNLAIAPNQVSLDGETYDVCIDGGSAKLLIPVKTRETMGGGHSMLFTRDIHKSVAVAAKAKYDCLPIVIAESWGGDLKGLSCKDFIHIDRNPNQVPEVRPMLEYQLRVRLPLFKSLE